MWSYNRRIPVTEKIKKTFVLVEIGLLSLDSEQDHP